MGERPIIFSAPMVRALLEGRKTQTRRVLKPPYGTLEYLRDGTWRPIYTKCFRGDRLWVREAFIGPYAYEVNNYPPRDWGNKPIWFPADGPAPDASAKQFWHAARPSIHMPRWASRLTLTVTEVRVQRLQDITRGEAMEEGCPFPNMADGPDPRAWFRDLWNDLHDKGRGHTPWWENPWVAALTFTVQHGNIDQLSQSPERGGMGPGPS